MITANAKLGCTCKTCLQNVRLRLIYHMPFTIRTQPHNSTEIAKPQKQ